MGTHTLLARRETFFHTAPQHSNVNNVSQRLGTADNGINKSSTTDNVYSPNTTNKVSRIPTISALDHNLIFITCEIFDFRKYGNRPVTLFVCFYVCLFAPCTPQFCRYRLEFFPVLPILSQRNRINFWTKSVQGHDQGRAEVKNTFLAITSVLIVVETSD